MQKITVNGVTYDNVASMPPDVRQVYEQAMANAPELADRNADGIPDIVQGAGPIQIGTTIRKRLVVNGQAYDDVKDLPPDVRVAYDQAMSALSAGGPNVKKNVVSIQIGRPTLSLHVNTRLSTGAAGQGPVTSVNAPPPGGSPAPAPIEPGNMEGGLRGVLIGAALAAAGLAVWLLMQGRH